MATNYETQRLKLGETGYHFEYHLSDGDKPRDSSEGGVRTAYLGETTADGKQIDVTVRFDSRYSEFIPEVGEELAKSGDIVLLAPFNSGLRFRN